MSDPHPAVTAALDSVGADQATRALIAARHGEPHRHYHTLRHIDLMLRRLPADHPLLPEMMAAALFHDIVYDPASSDNEAQSRDLFLSAASGLTAGAALDLALVSAMILATKGHHFRQEAAAGDAAINLVLKADLSILWHPDTQTYAWYARGVRREYGFVPDDQFAPARTKILTGLRDDLLGSGKLTGAEAVMLVRNTATELD